MHGFPKTVGESGLTPLMKRLASRTVSSVPDFGRHHSSGGDGVSRLSRFGCENSHQGMGDDIPHESSKDRRSCAIYRAMKDVQKPIQRDKSRSHTQNGWPILFVITHHRPARQKCNTPKREIHGLAIHLHKPHI
jgi:hypothetical protein